MIEAVVSSWVNFFGFWCHYYKGPDYMWWA